MSNLTSNYNYSSANPTWSNSYLWPPLKSLIVGKLPIGARILDVGCGAGATAGMLADFGFEVIGIDTNIDKVEVDRESEVMRARLYYLRNRTGKAAVAVKEREVRTVATPASVVASAPATTPVAAS